MRKKQTLLFAAVLVLTLAFCSCALAKSYKLESGASVYESASSHSAKIGTISKGEYVDVVSKTGDWAKIEMGVAGHPYGYIKTKHLKNGTGERKTTTYYVKDSSASVHSDPDNGSYRYAYIKKGYKVSVKSIDSGWAKIVWNNGSAYVKSKHLSRTKPTAATPAPTAATKRATPTPIPVDEKADYSNFVSVSYKAIVTPSAMGSYTNLRWGPGKNTPVMSIRYSGDVLTVLAQNAVWCQVRDEKTGEVGFMMRRFLTPVSDELVTNSSTNDEEG